MGSLGPLTPPASAASPKVSPPSESTPVAPDAQVVEVDPSPIRLAEGGAGSGSTYTVPGRGIELRTKVQPPARPAARTEDAGKRTEHSRVFANPDGTYTQEISQGRLNYQDASGTWQPLDLSLVPDKSGPYDLKVRATDATIRFSGANADAALAKMTDGTYTIGLRAIGYGAADAPTGNALSFAGSGANGAVGVLPTDFGFEFHVTLDGSDAATAYSFALDTGGLTATLDKDGATVLLLDPSGDTSGGLPIPKAVGRISAPALVEGNGDNADLTHVSVQLIGPATTDIPIDVPADVVATLGKNEVLLTYRIDPTWLQDKARQFPVVLDPSVCIRKGTGCNASGAFDIWITQGHPTSYVDSSTTNYDHVGFYVATSGTGNAMTRGIFYFPDMALPDEGAMVTSASLTLREFYNYSGTTSQNIYAQLMTKAWQVDSSQATWNNLSGAVNTTYNSPNTHPCNAGGTDCDVTFDVGKMVRAWYTRRPQDWKANVGIQVRYDATAESNNKYEVSFYNGNTSTAGNRPQLTINYVVPAVGVDFAPELGNTYAPSAMDAGKVTKLPIVIRNNSSVTFNTATDSAGFVYKAAYRWFDDEGKAMACPTGGGDCTQALASVINAGANSGTFALNVQAPSVVGAYTLRIELAHVHVSDNKIDYASDWATPSKYFSRNKKILTSDNTRWVGSSVIERDEFGITVSSGGGTSAGELKSVALSDGNTLALNLGSANLHYEGGTTVGFDDLVDIGLSYGYDTGNVADCTGILAACGWYTSWDERIVPLGDYNFQYQGPSGNRYWESIDGGGQMGGGAPVLLERTRYTLWDESNLSGWTGTAPVVSTTYAYSGTRSLRIGGAGTGTDATYPSFVDITHNQLLSLWVKSTGADKAVLGIKVLDADNNDAASWFYYTFGGTSFGVGSDYKWINTGTALTSTGGYFLTAQNVFADARAAIPTLSKNLKFDTVDLRGATGGSNFLYYDALTLRANRSTFIEDAHPAWTANAQSGLSTDKVSGTSSLVITSAPLASSPDCVGCRNTDLVQYSWIDWYWKKAGGNSIAFVYYFKDARDTTKTGTITYYAGPVAPTGALNPVQVSPTLPTTWSHVHRNLLEDARQILGFYNDYPLGTSPSAPPAAPAPDGVTLTGYKLSGVDGTQALFDAVRHTMVPNPGASSFASDDFVASYPDRSQHFFNGDGLLERIVDKDGNTISLDWTWDTTKSGPIAYTLTTIHAPMDGSSAPGGTTYRRYLEVATTDPDPNNLRKVSFTERLGTVAAPINGRHNDFYVSKTTATGNPTYGIGDMVRVSPIQNPSATCASARPTGCDEFSYDTTTNHLLKDVRDPRWDGSTSGPSDYRWSINYSGATPFRVWDNADNAAALMLASYDTGSSTVYARALWQDADALAANTAEYVDLSPEGAVRASYAQKACTGTCSYGSSGTYPTAPTSADLAATTTLDGLARITSAFVYRTAGTQVTATRSMSIAAAKVDNYADPLAAGELAWSQSNDQFLASLKDTGGTNPDLYRTEYAYDADHQLIDTVSPVYNATPSYAGVINSKPAQRKAYWRLDDASGNALDQAGTYPLTVSATGVTRSQSGGLLNDADTSMSFTAASSGRLSTTSLSVSQSAYTMAAWLKVTTANQKNVAVIGDFASNSGTMINLDVNGYVEIAHGSTRVVSTVIPTVGRWYQVVATWSATTGDLLLYIDGDVAAQGRTTTAPGAGATTFEIAAWGNGTAGTFINAAIDEAAYYDTAITPVWVSGQYQAGRSITLADRQIIWDGEGHPIQQATSFLANGGFESGLQGWGENQGADPHVLATPDSTVYSGFGSLQIDGTDFIKQPFQLVPGQTFRFQVAHRTDGGASTRASLIVEYWRPSTASWVALKNVSYSNSTWATHAWDFTLPMDSNGVVQVVPFNGAYTGTAWFDDALVVTDWQQQTPAANGVLADTYAFGGAAGTVRTHHQQDATADHPGIFDTIVTANYHDVPGTAPDSDVATTSTVDAWGRTTRTVDDDAFVVGAQAFAANNVDVASATDNSGRTTSFTYDPVGNRLTATDAAGLVSSFTYDLRDHAVTATAPDGVKTVDSYNGYGQRTSTTANWVDGSPSGPGGTDDVATTYAYDAYGRVTTTIADAGVGLLGAKSTASFDLLGNTISATVYADSAYTQARTTTNRFETYQPTSGPYSTYLVSRGQASGVQLPIFPTAGPAPLCPDGSGVRCNNVAALDLGGRTVSVTDAYGIVTRTYFDLAGRPVRVVANETTAGDDGLNDQNITTDTVYDTRGNPVKTLLPLTTSTWRSDVKAYDALSRLVSVTHRDANGLMYRLDTTTYWPSGRVRTTTDGSSTTETRYDSLGRAFATIANADPNNNAGMAIDAFEGTQPAAWQSTASGFFTTIDSDATAFGLDAVLSGNEYTTIPPVSGRGRLQVRTSATAGSGTWRDFSGPMYQGGHTYKVAFDVRAASGMHLEALFGQDASGSNYGQVPGGITADGTWQRITISWQPVGSISSPVAFAVRKDTAGVADFYLDNVVVWDSTVDGQGRDWSQTGIVSSLTGYDADARVNATVLPPGDPASDRPLVTTTAPDAIGRTTMTVVNDVSGSYAAAIEGTTNLVGYFPLDETAGSTAADQRPNPGVSLGAWTKPIWGIAGALDEARTAARFSGSNGYLSRSSAVTSATTNVAMEAWIRTDITPTDGNTHGVAWNGSAANGWGLAINSAGKASGFVAAASAYTTMQSSIGVTDGAWHHLVLTRDTTTWTLYVDGASASLSPNTSNPGTPGAGFAIGALPDASRAFVGDVDDVSVSAATMAAATAAAHYAAGRRPAADTTTALATRTNFDELGRTVDTWSPSLATLASGATAPTRTHAVLDRLGHQLETWQNDQVGAATTPTGDTNVKSTFAYDVLGELIGYCPAVQVQGTGGCTVTSGTEPKAWHYAFDSLGRQTKTIPPVNTMATALVTSETVYETGGRVAQTCTYPAGTSCTATNGRHVDFTYDGLARVLTQKTWDKSSGTDVLKFTKTLGWNADGSQASVAEGATTLNYTYDTAGRPSTFKNGSTQLTAWTYTFPTSTVATRTDGPVGTSPTTFGYDWARRVTSITAPSTFVSGTVTRTYRLDGTLATQSFPSSITETLGYDAVKRPVSISLGAAGTISQTFDRGGRVTSDGRSLTGIAGDAGGGTQSFFYDSLSRLGASSGPSTTSRSYQYDLDGNRTRRVENSTTTDFTYDRTDTVINQTIGVTTRAYGYDRFGNLTSASDNTSATSTYAYDEANRLTTINPPTGGQVTFTVDPLDRHALRAVGGTTSDNYGYLGPTETAWSTGLTPSATTSLLDVDGTRLAIKTGSTVSWLIFDLHGSVVALCTAGTTTLSDAYRYDGYGQLLASSGSATNPYRYRGRLNIGSDSLTWALADMGARDYSPQLGTFTQLDSVQGQAANPLSMNRFLYALANPATLVDPDGHAALEDETCKTCGYAVTSSTGNYTVVSHGTTTIHRRINGHDVVTVRRNSHPHNPCVGRCGDPFDTDRIQAGRPYESTPDCGLLGLACSDPNGVGGTLAGVGEGLCNFTVCGAWQLITKPGETLGGIGNVLSSDWNSISSGRAFDDLATGWNAMLGMSSHDKAEFWTSVVGGGYTLGRGVTAATSLARGGVIEGAAPAVAAESARAGTNFVVTEGGTAIPIPRGFVGMVAENGRGLVYRAPGSQGNANILRIGDADQFNPAGYVRYYNEYGQPLDAFGNPGPNAATHLPITGGTYPGFNQWLGGFR